MYDIRYYDSKVLRKVKKENTKERVFEYLQNNFFVISLPSSTSMKILVILNCSIFLQRW